MELDRVDPDGLKMSVSPLAAAKPPADEEPAAAPAALVQRRSWRDADASDDCYVRCLRRAYFPFLVANSGKVLIAWFAVLVISAIFGLGIVGPGFLNSTRSNLDLPKGTPSGDAVLAFQGLYPQVSSWAPAVIVFSQPGADLTKSSAAARASAAIGAFSRNYSGGSVVGSTTGFFEFMQIPGLDLLARQSVSPDNSTLIMNIAFKKSTKLDDINHFIDKLIPFAEQQSSGGLKVAATGLFSLFRQMSLATEESFSTIDGIVIPIALVILGLYVRSYRHIGIALVNLILALLLSFAVLTPIGAPGVKDINPFAPSIMLSLGVAVCFDYSLFLITRFYEERIMHFKSKEDAVFEMMATAGHVVLLSGGTLTATFIILLFFEQNFLQSVGYACSVTTAASVIVNLSVTPSMFLAYECLGFFDTPTLETLRNPARRSCCCWVPSHDPGEAARAAKEAHDAAVEASGEAAAALRARELAARGAKGLEVAKERRSVTFAVPWVATSPVGRWVTMAFVLLLTIPFLITVLALTPTSDDHLIFLQGSTTLDALSVMTANFPEGRLNQYQVIVSTGTPNSVLSPDYFAAENAVVHSLLSTQPDFVNRGSFAALSFFNGADVPFSTAMEYLNLTGMGTSPRFFSSEAAGWRSINFGKISSDFSSSLITIETTKNPNGQVIVPFIVSVRKVLSAFSASAIPRLKLYLFGGYTTTMDVQDMLYKLVPADIGAVVALVVITVAVSFRSVGLSVRLIVTIALSLCWTFGLTVLVYQPGPAQTAFARATPTILASSGVYWIIPIMSFSILVGLALDYDIFLVSRMMEFRALGWSDRASVCLSVEKTGGVITTAGLIMSVSFMGLLIPKTVVLNQYGFTLFLGVAFDTFLIRPIVVPAFVVILASVSQKANWWPTTPATIALTEEEEEHALAAGVWSPSEYREMLAATALKDAPVSEGPPVLISALTDDPVPKKEPAVIVESAP